MSYDAVAFYVTAHEDDWELFRGEVAYDDVNSAVNKIVFIHTTAGDAGRKDGWWEAREQGAVSAVRSALGSEPLTTQDVQSFNGHPLQRYVCGNAVIYFMRLPDGTPEGTGYESTGYQSLSQLRDSSKPITAVDGSTTYTDWADFCRTLSAVVDFECQDVAEDHPWINASDYSSINNPGDHADHKATADAVRTFASPRFNRAWFLTYCISALEPNLSGDALANKKVTFDAYSDEVFQMTGSPPIQEEWDNWGTRSYVRLVNFDQPDLDNPPRPSGVPSIRTSATFVDAIHHPTHARPPRRP